MTIVSKGVSLAVPLLCILIADAQSVGTTPKKIPGSDRPMCTAGAICFSGKVSDGEEFHKTLNAEMEFVLGGGWGIAIVPMQAEGECQEFASVVNAPYREHRDLYINMTYGWTAEREMSTSPREFRFVTNCADYRAEHERLYIVMGAYKSTPKEYDEAMSKLGTSQLGNGRLWITDSKISHLGDTPDNKLGKVEWMEFSVEIRLPTRKVGH